MFFHEMTFVHGISPAKMEENVGMKTVQALLVGYIESKDAMINGSKLATFLRLIDYNLRTNSLHKDSVLLLSRLALEQNLSQVVANDKHSSSILNSCQVLAQKSVATSEEHLIIFLTILVMRDSVDPKGGDTLLDVLQKVSSFSTIVLRLLERIFGGLDSFLRQVISKYAWNDPSIGILKRVLHALPPDARESTLERLAETLVKSNGDLESFLRLHEAFEFSMSTILQVYDILVALDFPERGTIGFCEILHMNVDKSIKDNSLEKDNWAYCSLFFSVEKYTKSRTSIKLSPIFSLLKVLLPVADAEKVGRLCHYSLEKASSFTEQDLLVIYGLVNCLTSKTCFHKALWSACCERSVNDPKLISKLFDLIFNHSMPSNLFNATVAQVFDVRNELFLQNGFLLLEYLERILSKILEINKEVDMVEYIDGLWVSFSALVRAPYSHQLDKVKILDFSRLHQEAIIRIFGLCCIVATKLGRKTWDQIIGDYSPTSPWILYGSLKRHQLVCYELYSLWLDRLGSGVDNSLWIGWKGIFVTTAVLELICVDCPQPSTKLAESILCLIGHSHSSESIYHSIYGLLSAQELEGKAFPLIGDQILHHLSIGAALRNGLVYTTFCLKVARFISFTGPKLVELATYGCIANQHFNLEVMILLATMVHDCIQSESLNHLDLYLYRFCISPLTDTNPQPISSTCSSFLLNRLTSIFLAQGSSVPLATDHFRSLYASILSCCAAHDIQHYLLQLKASFSFDPASLPFFLQRILWQALLRQPQQLKAIPLRILLDCFEAKPFSSCSIDEEGPLVTEPVNRTLRMLPTAELCSLEILPVRFVAAIARFKTHNVPATAISQLTCALRNWLIQLFSDPDSDYYWQIVPEEALNDESEAEQTIIENHVDDLLASEGLVRYCSYHNDPLYKLFKIIL